MSKVEGRSHAHPSPVGLGKHGHINHGDVRACHPAHDWRKPGSLSARVAPMPGDPASLSTADKDVRPTGRCPRTDGHPCPSSFRHRASSLSPRPSPSRLLQTRWFRNSEKPANSQCRARLDLSGSGNRRFVEIFEIELDVVTTTVVMLHASVITQVAFEIIAIQRQSSSAIAPADVSCRASLSRDSRSASAASCALMNASSTLSASVISSGRTAR